MKHFLRLLFFFALPIVIGLCLFSLTWPLVLETSEIAGEIIYTSRDAEGLNVEKFLTAVNEPRYIQLQRLVHWSQVSFIVLSMILGASTQSRTLGVKKIADLATAIALGILTSKFVIGYPFLDWPKVFAWGTVGLACFVLVYAVRSAQYRRS